MSTSEGAAAAPAGGDGEISAELAQAVLKKDAANIVQKVRGGKTLTTSERELIESLDPTRSLPVRLAARFNCSREAAHKWVRKYGVELCSDEVQLALKLIAQQKSPGDAIKRVCYEIIRDAKIDLPESGAVEGGAGTRAIKSLDDLDEARRETQANMGYTRQCIIEARALGDRMSEKHHLDMWNKQTDALVRIYKTQFQLGQNSGQVISRDDCARMFRAIGSRIAFGIQKVRDEFAADDSIALKMDDKMITQLLLAPMARASGVAAGCGLPAWVVEAINDTVANLVADGEAALKEAAKKEQGDGNQ